VAPVNVADTADELVQKIMAVMEAQVAPLLLPIWVQPDGRVGSVAAVLRNACAMMISPAAPAAEVMLAEAAETAPTREIDIQRLLLAAET
jgi:hypothetical protein